MNPLDIKSTRPSREALTQALTVVADAGSLPGDEQDRLTVCAVMLARELLALQHGAEELAHKWRQQWEDSGHDYELASCQTCADELDKLMRGSE